MRRRHWALIAWVAGIACASAQESGQTGSAACAGPTHCPCDVLGGALLVEASVVEISEDSVALEIVRVLSAPPDGAAGAAGATASRTPVDAGAMLSGSRNFLCGGYQPELEPGAHVLAAELPQRRGLWVALWGDRFSFGPVVGLSLDEVVDASDTQACFARFPPQNTAGCNDTPSYAGQSASCAMPRSAH
jgi:hypothetical protein